VNCQSTVASEVFLEASHARTSRRRVSESAIRRLRHWTVRTRSSISATFNQLPCFGEGQTYSEGELADAVSRIRRLPFVRAVSFSLAKGSERGLYRLVIAIDPMMSLFFDGQASSFTSDNQTPRTNNVGILTVGPASGECAHGMAPRGRSVLPFQS
jgi:hypothetical protein